MLQLVWNDSFAKTPSFPSFLTWCPDLATGHSAIDLNIQSFFLLVSRRIYMYINTHIISYVYINRMICAQEDLAKFGYRSEMKVEKFRNGAIFWPHANNLKLSKYGYFTKKGKLKKLPKFITNCLPHERVLKDFFFNFHILNIAKFG
jgi:hypothetical protein